MGIRGEGEWGRQARLARLARFARQLTTRLLTTNPSAYAPINYQPPTTNHQPKRRSAY
ncbi:MAG: hypothetical protein ACHBN1_03330 [Heteroscytonema crispum UTEX LB 1556]